MKKKLFKLSKIFVGIIAILLTNCENPEVNIQPLTMSWEKAVPNQEVPEGLTSLSSKECGVCHQLHYEEWKLSTHSHAWTDLQFQAELKKESSPFMCINCHIPLQNQQEFIIEGLIEGDIYKPLRTLNPKFDRNLQKEGINCVSCHVRDNVIIGPSGTTNAPHKTVKNTKFLSENLCITCHNATAVITPTLACTFETGDEWKSGPYFGEKNCISCHMESTHRENVIGYGKKLSHYHSFAGSGIPKISTVETKTLNGLGIYPTELKSSYSQMETIDFSLKIKNEFAGHKVPTGDPERFIKITFTIKNEEGTILTTKTERIGEKWEWYPAAKKISDNNLHPNEERLFTISHKALKKEQLKLTVSVTKHRMDKKTAKYNGLDDTYPLFISVFEKEYDIVIK